MRFSFTDTPAAYLILIVTSAVSLLALFRYPKIIEALILKPYFVFRKRQYHTVITSSFIHADFMHLFFNMLTFYFFGPPLEYVMGTARFVLFYIVSMILADLSMLIKQRSNPHYSTLGASGALSAVLFSYILFDPSTKLYLFFIPIGIPAPLFAAGYVALSFYFSRKPGGRINHESHLYGALAGLVITFLYYPVLLLHKLSVFLENLK